MVNVTNFAPQADRGSANDAQEKMHILIADDDSTSLRFIATTVEMMGHVPLTASNGKEALNILEAQKKPVDVIFLDRIMPFMDGVAVWEFIQHDPVLSQVPVIMQGRGDEGEEEGRPLSGGLFYRLNKPYDPVVLQAVLGAAIRQSQQNRRLNRRIGHHQAGFNLMSSAKFRFRTLEEAEGLACFIANCFPDPGHVVTGLAELMINAIEHGNLRIGDEEKADLLKRGQWHQEVQRRLADPGYADLYAEIAITRRDGGIYVVITDQGEGFAWQNYIRIDPERAARVNGRGIAHAATVCFDTLRYDSAGKKAIAFVQENRPLSW